MNNQVLKFIFFGTDKLALHALSSLEAKNFLPEAVVTAPDGTHGRGKTVAPSPVKEWALEKGIKVFTPQKLNDAFVSEIKEVPADIFVVASYGKIIPAKVFDMPRLGTINIHPSLLPKLRGPSPIQAAILGEDITGVSIMRIDEEVDHGPVLSQREVSISPWPDRYEAVEEKLGRIGGEMLAEELEKIAKGKAIETPQNHSLATFTKKFTKEDGLLELNAPAEENYKKFCAFSHWPGTYFFATNKQNGARLRVVIKDAKFENGIFEPLRVVPEGRKEMDWKSFTLGYSAQ